MLIKTFFAIEGMFAGNNGECCNVFFTDRFYLLGYIVGSYTSNFDMSAHIYKKKSMDK